MTFIVRWIIKWLLDHFEVCFSLVTSVTEDCFDNTVIISLLKAFQTVGLPLIAFAILTLLLKTVLSVSDGENINFVDVGKRCIFGIIVYMYGVEIMKLLYLVMLSVCKNVLAAIAGMTGFETDLSAVILTAMDVGFISLTLLVLIIYYMLKIFLSITERFWQMLVLLCMMYIYLPGYVAGDDESIPLWFKQCISVGLTQIFQSVLTTLAFSLYAGSASLSNVFLTIGALVAASKVEQLLDRYGMSVGGKLGGATRNAMSTMFYAQNSFKMLRR